LPENCHSGANAHAFLGGYRLWAGAEAELAGASPPAPGNAPGT
jgi:hypothetical protein